MRFREGLIRSRSLRDDWLEGKNVIDPEDTEMLEDLIVAGVNEANKKVDDMMAAEMSKITGGMKLPGMF